MFMADAPGYDYDNKDDNNEEVKEFKLTKDNALEFFSIKVKEDNG